MANDRILSEHLTKLLLKFVELSEASGVNLFELPPEIEKKVNGEGPLLDRLMKLAKDDVSVIEWMVEEIERLIEERKRYFPSPTSTAYLAPVFTLGLQKTMKPIDIKDGYETILTYLTHEKPQHKTQLQMSFLDDIPGERLSRLENRFRGSLSAHGMKCLFLVIAECAANNRNPWFNLDINRALDLMGYKRTKRGPHEPRNRKKLLQTLEDLHQITFNVERRAPKKKYARAKDLVIKFQSPLLSITGKFEEREVDEGRPFEEGVVIRNGVQIFIHPEIYKYIHQFYTFHPMEFLKIDVNRHPHAMYLYSYLANQWRIGWHEHRGVVNQTMRQILEGTGLIDRLPKRKNQQRDFIEKLKGELRWLKKQPEYWIDKVEFKRKRNETFLDQKVMVLMGDGHPLRLHMTEKRPQLLAEK